MAIEKVGGSRAYVIKGTSNPSARANYWANLVTQEKYKLWEQASQEALSQMKQEELEYRTEADIYKSQLKSLTDYRNKVSRDIASVRQDLLEGKTPKESTSYSTRPKGGGAGSTSAFDRELKDIKDTANDIAELKAEISLKGGAGLDMTNQQKAVKNNEAYLKNKRDKLEGSNYSNRDKVIAKNLINEALGEPTEAVPAEEAKPATTTGTTTTTTRRVSGGLTPEAIKALEDEIARLEAEVKTTQASIDELVPPTLSKTPLLERTREVLGEQLQPVERIPRSRPLSQRRIEELEALGMEPNFIQEQLSVLRGDKEAPEEPLFSGLRTNQQLTPTEQMDLANREARLNQFLAEQEAQQRAQGLGPLPEKGSVSPTRALEMETLGLTPTEPQEFVETPVPSRREARQLARETYNPPEVETPPPQPARPPEMDFEFAEGQVELVKEPPKKTNAELSYKREVIVASNNEDALSPLTKEDKEDWVAIVESLYTPTQNQSPQERAELLQNAWQEITLAYSEDRETMKKAHTLLLAIDKDYNKKQKPK